MKKSILALVLASLALPAMSISTSQQARVNNAMATLQSHGIDPTIVADNISDKLNLGYNWGPTGYDNWIYDLTEEMTITSGVGGDLIVNEGNAGFRIHTSGTVFSHQGSWYYPAKLHVLSATSSTNLFGGAISQIVGANDYKFGQTTVTNSANVTVVGNAAETWYDQLWADKDSYGIHQEGENVAESLGEKVGETIVDYAKNLKDGIKTMAYQTAAADIGKSMTSTCTNSEGAIVSAGVCGTMGAQLIDISSKITDVVSKNDGYLVEGAKHSGNNGFYAYLEERSDYWGTYGGVEMWSDPYPVYQRIGNDGVPYSDIRTAGSLSNLGGTSTKHTLLDTFSESLDGITEVANAFSDLDSTPTGYGENGNSPYVNYINTAGVQTTWVARPDYSVDGWGTSGTNGVAYRRLTANGSYTSATSKSYLLNVGLDGTYFEDGSSILFSDIEWENL